MRTRPRLYQFVLIMSLLIVSAIVPASVAAVQSQNISGLVPKNGHWAYYTTSRCTSTGGTYPRLQVQAWAGDNADMYFYIRSTSTGLAIGNYTESNPLHIPLHNTGTFNFGTLVSGTCFLNTARKDGFPLASGSETWTGIETW